MKSAEQALQEWASDEIAFDFGRGTKRFTKDQFTHICEALKADSALRAEFVIQVTSENGDKWRVPLKSFIDEASFSVAQRKIRSEGKFEEFHPRVAMQYQTLSEICDWASDIVKSNFTAPFVPPVDPWMQPLR